MSFADPQSITIDSETRSLPRTSVGQNESTYTSADGQLVLKASSQYAKRTRRVIRVDFSKVTADPFRPSENVKVGTSQYLVFDIPPAGFTPEEIKDIYDGFIAALEANSDALITKLLGGES